MARHEFPRRAQKTSTMWDLKCTCRETMRLFPCRIDQPPQARCFRAPARYLPARLIRAPAADGSPAPAARPLIARIFPRGGHGTRPPDVFAPRRGRVLPSGLLLCCAFSIACRCGRAACDTWAAPAAEVLGRSPGGTGDGRPRRTRFKVLIITVPYHMCAHCNTEAYVYKITPRLAG